MLIREARPEEADALAALAVRSKAHWPYPEALIARFARSLGLTPEVIAANDVWVAEHEGAVRGFSTLLHRGPVCILDDLWVEPAAIGSGVGRALFEHAAARAAARGAAALEWDAEPYAVGFYERVGGRQVGLVGSPLGRNLPVMRLPLEHLMPGQVGTTGAT
ncbi:GNAT family N-acetyltransferase [Pseudonocardia sp. GCM10023141]|uniref:GNAT family N-acetyltransferase n=1 Tax=Pseudonocardia sp. GCM10023141 TaxID=3252653 RepID=UPI00361EA745